MPMPDYRFDREDNVTWLDPAAPALPKLEKPYYWHIKVNSGPEVHVNVYLKRRIGGLFTTAIEDCGNEYIIVGGYKYEGPLDKEVAAAAQKVYDGRFNQDEAIKALRKAFPEAKVTKQ